MKKILCGLFLALCCSVIATDTPHYAKAAGGNWSAAATWSATSSAGADNLGAPAATDTVYFDTGANNTVTVDTNSCVCKVLICQAAVNSIAFGTNDVLTVSGSITLYAGMTFTGATGLFQINNNSTLNTNGVTIPCNLVLKAAVTVTLAHDLAVTGYINLNVNGTYTFTGNYDTTCATLYNSQGTSAMTLIYPASKTLTVTNSIHFITPISNITGAESTFEFKSGTTNTQTKLVYTGVATSCRIMGAKFTDVDASGSSQAICVWNADTLTNVTNIFARNDASTNDIYGGE